VTAQVCVRRAVGSPAAMTGGGAGRPEVRWFGPGDGPDGVRWACARRRTDRYDPVALGEDRSVKCRGDDGPLEQKVRVGGPEPVEVAGVVGFAERWCKTRLPRPDGVAWLAVHKTVVRRRGIEVCRLEVADERWWSIAVRLDADRPPALPAELRRWLHRERERVLAASYPAWLLQRCGRSWPGTPSAASGEAADQAVLEWAMGDSNPRPLPCEGSALTN
jgi:hypothetical protein